MMRLQLSFEILAGMSLSLLIALMLLHCFANANALIVNAQNAISGFARLAGSYPARLLSG